MQYWAVYMPVDPIACIPTVVCPEPGDNCATQFIHPALRTDQLEMLFTFQRMSQNDSATYFFNNFNWQEKFPDLNARDEVVSKIISGEYKVKLMADSSVVITSGDAWESSNIVFAYDLARQAAPCY
jgi:hypothetical protein